MRKIKFRGKRVDNGEWVYGDLIHGVSSKAGKMYILPVTHIYPQGCNDLDGWNVIPETVGQFTGFYVKKSKKSVEADIYEDDVFRAIEETDNGDINVYLVVMWIEKRGAFYLVPVEHYDILKNNDVSKEKEFDWLFQDACLYDFSIDVGLTKVGNIHDNPELTTRV